MGIEEIKNAGDMNARVKKIGELCGCHGDEIVFTIPRADGVAFPVAVLVRIPGAEADYEYLLKELREFFKP